MISLVVTQAQLNILHQYGYVSQTGPAVILKLRTWSERSLIVMILSVQVENWKSRPPDNGSVGCGICRGFLLFSYFFSFFPPAFPPIFLDPKPLRRRVLRNSIAPSAVENGTFRIGQVFETVRVRSEHFDGSRNCNGTSYW